MTKAIVIGVDIGTTGVRAAAYQLGSSHALAIATGEYPLFTDQSGKAEQDVILILNATLSVIKKTILELGNAAKNIKGIAFSTVFHSLIALSEDGIPLTKVLTWADSRGQIYLNEISKQINSEELYHRTGCPLHPMYPLLKIYFFKKEHPEIFQKTKWIGSIKDFIFFHFTGKKLVDSSIASGSGCYNIYSHQWDDEVLTLLSIDPKIFPKIVPTTHSENLNKIVANQIGLDHEVPVIIGAGDGIMANIGVGAIKSGQINITIGTSGAIRMASDRPQTDLKKRTWCYNIAEDRWMLGGAINNGGLSFRWIKDTFFEAEQLVAQKLGLNAYTLLTHYAEKINAGSDGLIMLPFFTGERSPYWNANARGTLIGLTLNHDKRHIVRATLEGICYRMRSILDSLEDITQKTEEIRVSGSFTHSSIWLQILSDVIGREICIPDVDEGAAYGAAIFGFYAIKELSSIDEASSLINIKKTIKPNKENTLIYNELYEIYTEVYWNLQRQFEKISNFQRVTTGK